VLTVVTKTTLPQSYCSNYGILAETVVSVCVRACEMEIRGTCWVIWRDWWWRRRIHCGNYSNCLCAENSCWEIRLNTCGKHTHTHTQVTHSHTALQSPWQQTKPGNMAYVVECVLGVVGAFRGVAMQLLKCLDWLVARIFYMVTRVLQEVARLFFMQLLNRSEWLSGHC